VNETLTVLKGIDVQIIEINISKTVAHKDEMVFINITVMNVGDVDAHDIDLHYYIDNEFQIYFTIEELEKNGGIEYVNFIISADEENRTYILQFVAMENDTILHVSENYTIDILPIPPLPDSEPPSLIITDPPIDTQAKFEIILSGNASDNVGVQSVEYRILGTEEWHNATGTIIWVVLVDTRELTDKETTFEFRAYDGYQYSSVESITITVDDDDGGDGGGGGLIPGFGVIALLGAIGVTVILYRRKRN